MQSSTVVRLEAGKAYYIEAVGSNAQGSNHLSVGVQLPNGLMLRPIPGEFLNRTPYTGKVEDDLFTSMTDAFENKEIEKLPGVDSVSSLVKTALPKPLTTKSETNVWEGEHSILKSFLGCYHSPTGIFSCFFCNCLQNIKKIPNSNIIMFKQTRVSYCVYNRALLLCRIFCNILVVCVNRQECVF